MLKEKIAKGFVFLEEKDAKGHVLLREKFCLRTSFALEIGVLQFLEVPPGGSAVSFFFPLFSPFFSVILFLLLWLGRIFSHFLRICVAFFLILFRICFTFVL